MTTQLPLEEFQHRVAASRPTYQIAIDHDELYVILRYYAKARTPWDDLAKYKRPLEAMEAKINSALTAGLPVWNSVGGDLKVVAEKNRVLLELQWWGELAGPILRNDEGADMIRRIWEILDKFAPRDKHHKGLPQDQ